MLHIWECAVEQDLSHRGKVASLLVPRLEAAVVVHSEVLNQGSEEVSLVTESHSSEGPLPFFSNMLQHHTPDHSTLSRELDQVNFRHLVSVVVLATFHEEKILQGHLRKASRGERSARP